MLSLETKVIAILVTRTEQSNWYSCLFTFLFQKLSVFLPVAWCEGIITTCLTIQSYHPGQSRTYRKSNPTPNLLK